MAKKNETETRSEFQGSSGVIGIGRRQDIDRTDTTNCRAPQSTDRLKTAAQYVCPAEVFSKSIGSSPPVDEQGKHAKIGQLTLEIDFLENALTKAGC